MSGEFNPVVSADGAGGHEIEVVRTVAPGDLSDDELAAWRALQAAHPELDRPFFAPEWFRTLDASGHAVEIVVLGVADGSLAFVPFHRHGTGVRPPGGSIADFQGWIGPGDLPIDVPALLRAVDARHWRFDHLLAIQTAAASHASERRTSPLADLSDGFDAFLARHKARGAGWVSQVPRKARKLGREVGELRFEMSRPDPDVLARLQAWKHAQRQRTRTADPLDEPWAAKTVAGCLAINEPEFAGMLSALWAGDELVAAHLGLRSRGTLHIWFPAYDAAHESYSPGLVLMYELFRAGADAGIRRVDFGKGPERYKSSWMTGEELLADGYIDLRRTGRAVSGAMYAGRRWVKRTPLAPLVRASRRWLPGLWRRLPLG